MISLRDTLVPKLHSLWIFWKSVCFFWRGTYFYINLKKSQIYVPFQKKQTLFQKMHNECNFGTKVSLRDITIDCMYQNFDKQTYFRTIYTFSSNFGVKLGQKLHFVVEKQGKTVFWAIFSTFITIFVTLFCFNPRKTIHFLKATDVSLHINHITWLYLDNIQTFRILWRLLAGNATKSLKPNIYTDNI